MGYGKSGYQQKEVENKRPRQAKHIKNVYKSNSRIRGGTGNKNGAEKQTARKNRSGKILVISRDSGVGFAERITNQDKPAFRWLIS